MVQRPHVGRVHANPHDVVAVEAFERGFDDRGDIGSRKTQLARRALRARWRPKAEAAPIDRIGQTGAKPPGGAQRFGAIVTGEYRRGRTLVVAGAFGRGRLGSGTQIFGEWDEVARHDAATALERSESNGE